MNNIWPGIIVVLVCALSGARPAAAFGEWRHYGNDHGGSKYVGLSQINAGNFQHLEPAWQWLSPDSELDHPDAFNTGPYKTVPLFIRGRMFVATGLGQVARLDPATGKTIWTFDPMSYAQGERPVHYSLDTRGLEYWTDGREERLLYTTFSRQLVSLNIRTGKPDPEFGDAGIVDLSGDLGRSGYDLKILSNTQPPIVVRDSVIVGSKVPDFLYRYPLVPGHVRAYDVRTGKLKWRFNTIPQGDEEFADTWENRSWQRAGGVNVWSFMTADDELGYVYLPVAAPTNDQYGGERPGDNLFAESLVCLDAQTGERIWHFQTVHHGVWDYDPASAPNLVDIWRDDQLIRAVALVTKTGFTYVFDRTTGEPVWPIEERPVPQSRVPGEKTSATQPHPTLPPPFDRQGTSIDDLIDFTPELRAEAVAMTKDFVFGPLFTPPIMFGDKGKSHVLRLPGGLGGANWPGAAVDPRQGILYVESQTRPVAFAVRQGDPDKTDFPYVMDYLDPQGPQGLPLFKPPYRRITAIDLNRGQHVWQIPFGGGPRNHPAIKHLGLGPLGAPYLDAMVEGGILLTDTLLVSIISRKDDHNADVPGSYLRAYSKKDGRLLAQVTVETRLHGQPMSYWYKEKQYIAVSGGGLGQARPKLIAFALPDAALIDTSTLTDTVPQQIADEFFKPIGLVAQGEPVPLPLEFTPERLEQGMKVYQHICSSCHARGGSGAPVVGNVMEWRSRLVRGLESLYANTINGFDGTAMPARGGCTDCSDQQLEAAVDYMIANSQSPQGRNN